MAPVVRVPVLSNRTVSTARARSNTSGFLKRMPSSAPRPLPTMMAVGVARPRAHGQAMISTATAARTASARSPLTIIHAIRVARAMRITTGTNTPEIRSANRWTGALPAWASSTRRTIWNSAVSSPTLVARTATRPC